MIVPIVQEDVWHPFLSGLAEFSLGSGPVVLVSPHPDDETLGAGGLLASAAAQGRAITLIAVTDGENAYVGDKGLGRVRIAEQEAALRRLCGESACLVRLGLEDSAVAAAEERLKQLLRPLIHADTHVLAPWHGDFHPDHEACGRASAAVAREVGARMSQYFFWTWHRGTPETLTGLSLHRFPLDSSLQQRKLRALECHASQLAHPSGEPILPETLLGPARRNFEVFAE